MPSSSRAYFPRLSWGYPVPAEAVRRVDAFIAAQQAAPTTLKAVD
jgi:hypothetical protein